MARSKKVERVPQKAAARKRARSPQTSSPASAGSRTASKLGAFYVDLASNLDKFSAFIADPAAAAEREGLSKEDIDLLFSGDQVKIYACLRPEMIPTPPQPQQPDGEAGAAAQAAPAPPSPFPPGYPYASQWPYPYGYGYGWPAPASSPEVQPASSCPAPQPTEQKKEVTDV
jgi:hypothetical protein